MKRLFFYKYSKRLRIAKVFQTLYEMETISYTSISPDFVFKYFQKQVTKYGDQADDFSTGPAPGYEISMGFKFHENPTIQLIYLPELCDGSCFELVSTCRTCFASTGQILQQTAATNCTQQ